MNRDEFNQMLEAHGIVFVGDAAWRVAQLVAEQERQRCADIADSHASIEGIAQRIADEIRGRA